ncbi:glycosyltransferase [Amylibacter sp.]|nr:glycosyltransferase [Amylibacter sp.]
MKLLTVLLPNYNDLSGFIRNYDQLKTQKNYKVGTVSFLISDDSNDNKIYEHYSEKISGDKQFSYCQGPKFGAVSNWNSCIEQVDSVYTMFLHHDEYISSEYFLSGITKILDSNTYDLIILPLVKDKNGRKFCHYPRLLKRIFIKFPFLLFSCNPFGSPSIIIFRNKISEGFDENLRWMVDVEWYFRFLKKRPNVLLLDNEMYEIISDLNFSETETNKMDVPKLIPIEKKYIQEKHKLKRYVFNAVWKCLRIPVKICEYFSA